MQVASVCGLVDRAGNGVSVKFRAGDIGLVRNPSARNVTLTHFHSRSRDAFPMTARIAVLASGRGSNLQALLDAIDARPA